MQKYDTPTLEAGTNIAVTFGRMNLPHPGHVNLVKKMLECGDQAVVCLSTAKKNTPFADRAELLYLLCQAEGLPMDRIHIEPASNPYDAVEFVTSDAWTGLTDIVKLLNTTVVLGVDQAILAQRLRDDLGVDFELNEVRIGSSTVIRYFLEIGEEQIVRDIYHNDDFIFADILDLRQEELSREKS
jgi:cytidyltransferase-like protein